MGVHPMILASLPANPAASLPTWLPWALLVAGVLLLIVVGLRTYLSARRNPRIAPRSARPSSPLIEPKPDLNPRIGGNGGGGEDTSLADLPALAADLEELSQHLAARLDAKAARLELLIAQADDRIDRLSRLEQGGGGGAPRVHIMPGIPNSRSPQPVHAAADEHDAGADPVTRQIYQLADEGLPPVEIARRLAQHTGKVELILALRQA
jgi:hypothetical protein